jgi:hypothetical protein
MPPPPPPPTDLKSFHFAGFACHAVIKLSCLTWHLPKRLAFLCLYCLLAACWSGERARLASALRPQLALMLLPLMSLLPPPTAANNNDRRHSCASSQRFTPDPEMAAVWYKKAAEQGDAHACRILGNAYASGTGCNKDDARAVHWWRKVRLRSTVCFLRYNHVPPTRANPSTSPAHPLTPLTRLRVRLITHSRTHPRLLPTHTPHLLTHSLAILTRLINPLTHSLTRQPTRSLITDRSYKSSPLRSTTTTPPGRGAWGHRSKSVLAQSAAAKTSNS